MPPPRPSARPRSVPQPPTDSDATARALQRAAVVCAGTQGYRGFTVADLLTQAGISRQTFYTRFPNKQACFTAAMRRVAADAQRQAVVAVADEAEPAERLRRVVGAALRVGAANPLGLRVLLLEAYAAGAETAAQRDALMDDVVALIGGPPDVARAVLGAVARVALDQTLEGRAGDLAALVTPMSTWAGCYRDLADGALPTVRVAASRRRGRAPGSLVPVGPEGTKRLRPGPKREPRTFVEHSQSDRILDAVASVVATKGYDGLTSRAIAAEAELSTRALYEHFASPDEAFAATLLAGGRSALAAALPASLAPTDWRAGVAAGLRALLEFFAEEPAFAHVALVDALAAGPPGARVQGDALDTLAAVIANGYERAAPATIGLVSEAVAAGAWELCADRVRRGRAADLPGLAPMLTVLALAPVVGLAEALEVAAG